MSKDAWIQVLWYDKSGVFPNDEDILSSESEQKNNANNSKHFS